MTHLHMFLQFCEETYFFSFNNFEVLVNQQYAVFRDLKQRMPKYGRPEPTDGQWEKVDTAVMPPDSPRMM